MKIFFYLLLFIVTGTSLMCFDFRVAVIKYDGGGDWYEGKVGIANLSYFIKSNTSLLPDPTAKVIELSDPNLNQERFLYLTGHGNVSLSPSDVTALRAALFGGSFLYIDDDYGLDPAIRREMKKCFPDKEWVELPPSHKIFHNYFDFSLGLPKIHEHNGKPPQALALFHRGRMIALYTYESNIGDGWAPEEVHHDPAEIRLSALKFGVNLILYSMSQ